MPSTRITAQFSSDDVATIAGTSLVAFDAALASIAVEHPHRPIAALRAMLLNEHDAQTGGTHLAVPGDVLRGVEELLRHDPPSSAPPADAG